MKNTQMQDAMAAAMSLGAVAPGITAAIATATPSAVGGNLSGMTFDQLAQTHAEAVKQNLKIATQAITAEIVRRYNGRVNAGKPIFPTMQTFMEANAAGMLSTEAKLWKKPEPKAKPAAPVKPAFDVRAALQAMGIANPTAEQEKAAYAFLNVLAPKSPAPAAKPKRTRKTGAKKAS